MTGETPTPADLQGIAAALDRLNERMGRLEDQVSILREMSAQAPAVASTVVDAIDGHVAALQARGIDVDERLAAGLRLLEQLTEPSTLAGLENAMSMAGQAPGFVSMVADTVDGIAARIQESGIDIDSRLRSTLELGEIMTAEATVDGLTRVLQPGAVSIVGMLGGALVSCFEECMTLPAPRRYTPIKALRMLGDHDVQTGLAFLINVARFFGQEMKARHASEVARRAAVQALSR